MLRFFFNFLRFFLNNWLLLCLFLNEVFFNAVETTILPFTSRNSLNGINELLLNFAIKLIAEDRTEEMSLEDLRVRDLALHGRGLLEKVNTGKEALDFVIV